MTASVLFDEPGPRGRRRIVVASVVGGLAAAGLLAVAVWRLADKGQLSADRWSVFVDEPDLRRLLWNALLDTLRAAATAMVFALGVGVVLAVGRLSRFWAVRTVASTVVELLRGLPLLMIILFTYLGLPALGWDLSAFWALVIGLTAYNGAVIAEIFRAGVLSVGRGQREAAEALGLRRGQTLRLVLFPQAVRRMLPTLVSQLVTLLKDTSLGFVIGYTELLREGRSAVEFLGGAYALPVYTAIAVMYIAVNGTLSAAARWLERRQGRRYGTRAAKVPELTAENAAL